MAAVALSGATVASDSQLTLPLNEMKMHHFKKKKKNTHKKNVAFVFSVG